MKLAWLTDVHFNLSRTSPTKLGRYAGRQADAVLITGDISEAPTLRGHLLAFAEGCLKPIYFVLGNHDYWGASFDGAVAIARQAAADVPHLHYLPDCAPIELDGVTLVGHDGFYDARCGDADTSNVFMNDWARIDDLRAALVSGIARYVQHRGREEAEKVAARLDVMPACDRLLFATHVPPFPDVVGKHLPWYTNLSLGAALADYAFDHPNCAVTVLAGHVHEPATADIHANLRVIAGRAEYGAPGISRIFDTRRTVR